MPQVNEVFWSLMILEYISLFFLLILFMNFSFFSSLFKEKDLYLFKFSEF